VTTAGAVGAPGEFAWAVPHDRALRRARALFVFAVGIIALYVVVPLLTLTLILHLAEVRPRHGILSVVDRGNPLVVAAVMVAAFLLVSGVVAAVAWRGVRSVVLGATGARRPTADEARIAAAGVEPFALARGLIPPTTWVIDDRAPNALAFGSPAAGHVCFTTGALKLPHDEFAALCAFELTALSSRPFAYCTAAIDVALLAEWCARILWTTAAFGFLSPLVGVPPEAAAVFVLCIAALIGITRLALVVADRALPRLLDDVAELVDLEAVRLTARPAPFARLIARLLADEHQVKSRWQVSHLWFERDSVELSRTGPRSFLRLRIGDDSLTPALARRFERSDPRGLQARARRAWDQANGVVTPPSGP
jgi:hypothetical protein